jgi:hypothetical protein
MTLTQLTIFFLAVVMSSAWCFGLHTVVKNFLDEVFDWDINSGAWLGLPRWKKLLFKPLFACPYCMASVWGTAIFWAAFSYMGAWYWIPFCVCLCGFNYFLNQFVAE